MSKFINWLEEYWNVGNTFGFLLLMVMVIVYSSHAEGLSIAVDNLLYLGCLILAYLGFPIWNKAIKKKPLDKRAEAVFKDLEREVRHLGSEMIEYLNDLPMTANKREYYSQQNYDRTERLKARIKDFRNMFYKEEENEEA